MLKRKVLKNKITITNNDKGNMKHWIKIYGSIDEVRSVFNKILKRLEYLDKKVNIKIKTETKIIMDPDIIKQYDLDIINIINQELIGYDKIKEIIILKKNED